MIEKQVPGIKFDIDREEHKANVIHNEIPNRRNKRQENALIFTMSNV